MLQVLKLAARFERLIKQRMLAESAREMCESDVLAELVSKYNEYKANSALKKWQISSDQSAAIWCIIIGLDDISRGLLRSHLDHNKWEESGPFAKICAKDILCKHVDVESIDPHGENNKHFSIITLCTYPIHMIHIHNILTLNFFLLMFSKHLSLHPFFLHILITLHIPKTHCPRLQRSYLETETPLAE